MTGLLGQQFRQDLLVGNRFTEDQFARHRPVEVILRDELGQHVGRLGIQWQARKEIARAETDAIAEEQHADAGHARLDAAGNHVHVGAGALHVMLRLQLAQCRHLVAQGRRPLELQRLAGTFHRLGQFVDHRVAAPLQEHLGVAHIAAVILGADQLHARRSAAADLVLQARPRAVAKIAVLTLAHLEQLLHQAEAFAHRVGTRIWPEIAPRQVAGAAMECQPWIVLATGQVNIWVAFAVAQKNVVARLQRLDQLRLQQQRLALGARHGDIDTSDLRHHRGDARLHPRLQEIAADALLEIAGLADIQQLTGRVEMTIDAG